MTVRAWKVQVLKQMKDKIPHPQVAQQIWIIVQQQMRVATGVPKHVVPGSQPKELLQEVISMDRFQINSKHYNIGC